MDRNNIPNSGRDAGLYLNGSVDALLELLLKIYNDNHRDVAQVRVAIIEELELIGELDQDLADKVNYVIGREYEADAKADHATSRGDNGGL